ncbi:myosin class II heavy chain [Pseudozyma hubeiensis SY62]|uniref:Myosin class II heavy chain n=1 Tax=Pseudozyma hubeiensis (strain SY62) TaxID=1305764 RepID=R9PBW1_PSEHS|nr:myosin class II heavy chain [Pseudozyma hubeiensis SY62]GAC98727.1 myosin class II heavy chain [Pseudozyma hubeiensis SY62]
MHSPRRSCGSSSKHAAISRSRRARSARSERSELYNEQRHGILLPMSIEGPAVRLSLCAPECQQNFEVRHETHDSHVDV